MKSVISAGKRFLSLVSGEEANQNGISLFEVKSLYDAAYAEKAQARARLKDFRARLKAAECLDAAYRRQLVQNRLRAHRQGV
ncbi:MAG: hypothetical protein KDK08_13045 [Rhizobiaceae bacterium]|nr:hypothetical protein [Rhizobiaceae bacterium]